MTTSVTVQNNNLQGRVIRVTSVDYATSQGGISREASEILVEGGKETTQNIWHGRSLVITEAEQ